MIVKPLSERPVHSWLRSLFCAGTVLMGPNNRAVDLGILTICIGSQYLRNRCQIPHLIQLMGECESLKSLEDVRADHASGRRKDNVRAPPPQRGDFLRR